MNTDLTEENYQALSLLHLTSYFILSIIHMVLEDFAFCMLRFMSYCYTTLLVQPLPLAYIHFPYRYKDDTPEQWWHQGLLL